MTKREMRCPHKPKISDCSGCMDELNAMKAPDRLEGEELHDRWYSVIDEYIYEINRLSQRNRRQEREGKIHALVELIVDFARQAEGRVMTTKQTQASPEQFLREFATEIMSQAWKYGSEAKLEATIKGWAKLLKLREEAVRDETRRLDYGEFLGMVRHMENNASQLRRHFEHRVEALTTPNNTSNTPKEGA